MRHLYAVLPLALYAVVVVAGPLRDNSFLWHVRAGSMQLASGRVLTTDPFSYMAVGEPWRTQSWLVELLYGELESIFGGVAWAQTLVVAIALGALGLIGLAVYHRMKSSFSIGFWLFVLGWLLLPFGVPRPVVFSYLLLAMLIVVLALDRRVMWGVIPIIWIWSGVHGSWVLGVGLVALVAIGRRSTRMTVVTAAAAAATVATAHGIGTWGIVLSFARNTSALDYMVEWSPPDFGSVVQAPYLIILVGLIVAAIKGRLTMSDLWVVVPFMLLGFSSNRTVPVAALVLVPFAARSVEVSWPAARDERFHALPWLVLAAAVAMVVIVDVQTAFELDPDRFPSDAALTAAGDGRFFHDDAVGGYLIYREGPERRVYIDDRVELYGATRFGEFIAARDGDYQEVFERYGMTSALVGKDWPLRSQLLRDGWRIAYADGFFEVLVGDQG